jgi:hypothetical protein
MELAYPTLRAFGRGDFLLDRLLLQTPRCKMRRARGLLLGLALMRLETRPDAAHTT